MTDQPADGRRFLKTFCSVAGLASFLTLAAMVVAGMDRVNTGGSNPLRTTWLVEVNWLAFLALATIVVIAVAVRVYLHALAIRELRRRLTEAGH